jgi:hypothetical protein
MLKKFNIFKITLSNSFRFYQSSSYKDLISIKKSIEIYNSKDKKRCKNKKIEKK